MLDLVDRRRLNQGLDLSLRTRNPFQVVSVRCGSSQRPIERRVLDLYLPSATALQRYPGVDMNNIIQRCYTVRTGSIPPSTMTLACRELLDVLGHSFKDKIEPHFALTTMLEHRVRNGEMNTACKLFFCVSDISRTTHSRALAEVLHSFFTKCGDEIIGQEDHAHVVYWGCAVMISNMSDSQKLDCIHIILKGFPELMLDSDYIGYNQPVVGMEYFVTAMHRVAEMDDDLHYGDRGRRRLREDNFLRRRRLGNNRLGSWHDDSLGYGSGYNSPFDSLREGLSMRPTKEMVRDVQQLYNNQKQLKDHVEFLTDAVEELRQDGFDGDFNGSDDWNHPRRVRSLEEDY